MKIKLSKSQWEYIGKIVGWIKEAATDKNQSDFIYKLFDTIYKKYGGHYNKGTKVSEASVEFSEESIGTSYIQIYYINQFGNDKLTLNSFEEKHTMLVEIYFEEEYLQNQWGKKVPIQIDFNDFNGTLNKIFKAIDIVSNFS